jgi:ankyrin repeat protein
MPPAMKTVPRSTRQLDLWHREIAELLFGSGASLDVRNNKQETLFSLSCIYGKRDLAQFLIDRGSNINSRDENSFIPLYSTLRRGRVDAVRLLMDCGVYVNARDTLFCLIRHDMDTLTSHDS